jgi:uncharacterized protein (TIGR00299 family) protein
VAHFDCFSGISGDMTLAALLDLGVPAEPIIAGIASLGLPITIEIEKVRKGGFAATQVFIDAPPQDEHRFLPDVENILAHGNLTPTQLALALKIFRRLAEAEAQVHGLPIGEVHFHEVGALDSIADIAGSAIALDLLAVERFTSSTVATGSGTVKCAHGVMPVPAPATAQLLMGVPLRPCPIRSELTTPTGAAILTSIVAEYVETPALTIEKIGHGAGRKEFIEQPNLLRIFLGSAPAVSDGPAAEYDRVWVLETNLDDVPGEIVGYAIERLFAAGALDVFTTPIQMKKNRPGILLTVLAPESAIGNIEAIVFRETRTFGIRRYLATRHKLQREAVTVETAWGPVQGKRGWRADGFVVFAPEYEDCARLARDKNLPLDEVYRAAREAWRIHGAKTCEP